MTTHTPPLPPPRLPPRRSPHPADVGFDARATIARATRKAAVAGWARRLRERHTLLWVALPAVAIVVSTVVALAVTAAPDPAAAVVRVRSAAAVASGFFVLGPDDSRYVVTSFAAVCGGAPVLVEPGSSPAVVVAHDAQAGVAIVRVGPADDGVPFLELADGHMAGANVTALGYGRRDPISGGASRVEATVDTLRSIKGTVRLQLSGELRLGMEGGPTVDDDGRVVGVNLPGGGAVDASVVRELIETIDPADAPPTPARVTDMLRRLQVEVLGAQPGERANLPSSELLGVGERPALERLLQEIRRRDADTAVTSTTRLSARAELSLWEARFSSMGLSTLRSDSVQRALHRCDASATLLNDLPRTPAAATDRSCEEKALVALAWDVLAASLQWSGRPRSFTATQIEPTDDANTFRVELSAPSLHRPAAIWITKHFGALRVRLFDDTGRIYARVVADPAAMVGEWERRVPRGPSDAGKGIEQQTVETLSITIDGDALEARHHVEHVFTSADGARFRCNEHNQVEVGFTQVLTGNADGAATTRLRASAEPEGIDAEACAKWAGHSTVAAVLVPVGSRLLMHRTDGTGHATTVELQRKRQEH